MLAVDLVPNKNRRGFNKTFWLHIFRWELVVYL